MKQAIMKTGTVLLVFLILDVLLAQASKLVFDWWQLDSIRLANYAIEKRYRIPSSIYHHDLAANVETEAVWGHARYPYRTNDLGFRDAAPRMVSKRPASRRLLILGDSFTEGLGVSFEETFAGIIADRLRPEGVDVLNAAVSSYSPAIYYRKTKYLLEARKLHFDHVMVFIDISDIEDEAKYYRIENDTVIGTEHLRSFHSPGRSEQLKIFLKENSVLIRLAVLLKNMVIRGRHGPYIGIGLDRALWTIDERLFAEYGADGLRRAGSNMDRLLDLLQDRHIGLTVVVYPWPDQIVNGDVNSRQVSYWQAWTEQRNVAFINLFPKFIDGEDYEATLEKHFIPGDTHWNESGHRLVAETVLANLEGQF